MTQKSFSFFDCTVVFLSTLVIYLMLPTTNYYWDGLIYGDFLEKVEGFGPHLFHPNHLIYNFLGYVAYRTGKAFDPEFRALYGLQIVTIFFGAACCALFHAITWKAFDSRLRAFAITALLAFAAGWWRFATDADVYIISIAFLLLSFALVFVADTSRPMLAALSFAVAALFHELAIFFVPVFFLVLLVTDGKIGTQRLGRAAGAITLSTAIILGAYLTAYFLTAETPSVASFLSWITQRADAANRLFTFQEGLFWLSKGTGRLFIDGSIKLVGRDAISIASFFLFVLLSLCLMASVLLGLKARPPDRDTARDQAELAPGTLVMLCLAWIAPYTVFLMIFMPENTFYRLFYFPPLILLTGLLLGRISVLNATRYTVPLLAAAFAMYNFTFYIYPNSYAREGTVLAAALAANRVWTPETRIVYDPSVELEGSNRLVAYFNPSTTWVSFDSLTPAEKASLFEGRTTWNDVWIASSILMRDPGGKELEVGSAGAEAVAAPKHNIRFVKVSGR